MLIVAIASKYEMQKVIRSSSFLKAKLPILPSGLNACQRSSLNPNLFCRKLLKILSQPTKLSLGIASSFKTPVNQPRLWKLTCHSSGSRNIEEMKTTGISKVCCGTELHAF
jgi:hypothetical protein